jgi:exodeoxyribonuclease VII large subunit
MLSAMSQYTLFEPLVWTISDLTRYIRERLESDKNLQDIWVQGEVSNVSRPASGHLYFTIKDRSASLRCVMWRSAQTRQVYRLQDGDAVEVHGSIGVYDQGGTYQLYVDLIRPAGQGILFQEFLRLKDKLEAEGLFDTALKKPIPAWPRTIGVVTSPTGAALRDILHTLGRRYPLAHVILAPSPVQGEDAPARLIEALLSLQRIKPRPDVILIARGGGSMEDLWAFNDENLARAVSASGIPVVSGVGHETDFTILDFVADLRAPTPTAAAELVTPDQVELRLSLAEAADTMVYRWGQLSQSKKQQLSGLNERLMRSNPQVAIRNQRQRLDEIERRLISQVRHFLQLRRLGLEAFSQKLVALNPHAILQRGYAVVRDTGGVVIRRQRQVTPGEKLNVQVSDGVFGVVVSENQAAVGEQND